MLYESRCAIGVNEVVAIKILTFTMTNPIIIILYKIVVVSPETTLPDNLTAVISIIASFGKGFLYYLKVLFWPFNLTFQPLIYPETDFSLSTVTVYLFITASAITALIVRKDHSLFRKKG